MSKYVLNIDVNLDEIEGMTPDEAGYYIAKKIDRVEETLIMNIMIDVMEKFILAEME